MKQLEKGFTLIEALVVLGIISAMALLIFVNVRTSRDERRLDAAARQLASDLRRVQNMAISGQMVAVSTIPFGYGLDFPSAKAYRIFYNPSESGAFGYIGTPNKIGTMGVILEAINLSEGVEFSSDSLNKIVYFLPPDPKTYICISINPCVPGKTAGFSLTLTLKLGNLTRRVVISTAGKIEVQ